MRGAAAAAVLKTALKEWRLVALARRLRCAPISTPGPCSSANCCCCRHCSAASLYRIDDTPGQPSSRTRETMHRLYLVEFG